MSSCFMFQGEDPTKTRWTKIMRILSEKHGKDLAKTSGRHKVFGRMQGSGGQAERDEDPTKARRAKIMRSLGETWRRLDEDLRKAQSFRLDAKRRILCKNHMKTKRVTEIP